VGPRAGLDAVSKRKISSPRRSSNLDHPTVQPVVSRYTDWAIPALRRLIIRGWIQNFPDRLDNEIKTAKINTRWEATQRVMAAKLNTLTHKIAIQLHPVAESCTIWSSRSRRPVRKLLDTPSYDISPLVFIGYTAVRFNHCSCLWRQIIFVTCHAVYIRVKVSSRVCTPRYDESGCDRRQDSELLKFGACRGEICA
jgi:hypothetical protein